MLMTQLAFGLDSFEQLGVSALKLVSKFHVRFQSFLVRAVNFSALDALAQLLLERTQNLIAPFCILPVLLIAIEPERRVNADEHQN